MITRQHGRITWAQLRALGASEGTIGTWIRDGRLTRVLPKVYAVGHTAASRQADLWAAVLYAGPGAMLSHASAAHHRGLIMYPPAVIHVSTPRVKIKSIPDVVLVHTARDRERCAHQGIPTTTVEQTVLDLAATEDIKLVRRALSVLDYHRQLDLDALGAISGKGRRGAVALRDALQNHLPQIAYTNQELERRFLELCERFGLPLPKCNFWIHGEQADAYWPEHGLVVEVDGRGGHEMPGQLRKDRRKELTLRSHGLNVVRYDWELVTGAAEEVAADLLRQLAAAR